MTILCIFQIEELRALIIQCAKSAVFETRKLAARALVSLLTENIAERFLTRIMKNVVTTKTSHSYLNLIHGYMLQVCILNIFIQKIFSLK